MTNTNAYAVGRIQLGSSLVETLVALFILAVGLLGILAMQAGSVKSNQRAYLSTEAQMLASDMADRILAYDDIDDVTDNGDYANINTAGTTSDPGCISSGCGKAQQVAYDEFQWGDELSSRLPGGIGTVSRNGNIYTITVMWDNELSEATANATGTGCSGDPTVDLACYNLELRL